MAGGGPIGAVGGLKSGHREGAAGGYKGLGGPGAYYGLGSGGGGAGGDAARLPSIEKKNSAIGGARMRSLPPKAGDGTPGGANYMGGMYNQNSQGLAGAQNNMAKPRMGGYAGLGGNNFGSYSGAVQGDE